MRIALDNLLIDVALLHQLVRDMASALDEGAVEAERLRLIIRQFQRARFGRRSEQLDPDQMAFGLEELEADLAWAEARKPRSAASAEPSKSKKPPLRAPLPPHLPRIDETLPVPHDACPNWAFAAFCRWMVTPGSSSLRPRVPSPSRPAGRMRAGGSTNCTRQARRWRARRCSGS